MKRLLSIEMVKPTSGAGFGEKIPSSFWDVSPLRCRLDMQAEVWSDLVEILVCTMGED